LCCTVVFQMLGLWHISITSVLLTNGVICFIHNLHDWWGKISNVKMAILIMSDFKLNYPFKSTKSKEKYRLYHTVCTKNVSITLNRSFPKHDSNRGWQISVSGMSRIGFYQYKYWTQTFYLYKCQCAYFLIRDSSMANSWWQEG